MNRRICSLLIGVAMAGGAGHAFAQATQADKAAAEALYEAGKTLLKTDVTAACDKFAASQELDPGVGTLLHLGACNEKLGRVASAWASFREAASYARRSGQPDREKTATSRADKLEPRLPKLVIDTSHSGAETVEITRDQKPVPSATLGVPIPVDPGSHVIAVSAPGKVTWQTTVHMVEGRTDALVVPPLEAAPSDEPVAPPVAAPPPAPQSAPPKSAPEPPPPPSPSGLGTRAKVGIGIGALGAVSLIAGSYFGLRTMSKWDESKQHCVGLDCDQTGVDLASTARVSGNVSTALFAVGAVALGTGAFLFFTSPKGTESKIAVGAAPGGALLSWESKL